MPLYKEITPAMMERNDQSFYDSIFKERCSHHYISGMKET
jgi:hypothetical protein